MSTVLQPQTKHIYDLKALSRAPDEPCSGVVTPGQPLAGVSAASHAAVKGERVQVAVVRQPRGTGSRVHADPGEQFHYILQGALLADIDGQLLQVPAGHVVHIPPGMSHRLAAEGAEDAVCIRHGMHAIRSATSPISLVSKMYQHRRQKT